MRRLRRRSGAEAQLIAAHAVRHRAAPVRALLALLAGCAFVPAQAERVPVRATATVDTAALATAGRAQLHLTFVADEPLTTACSVRVELRLQRRVVLRRDHAPPQPTTAWAAGTEVTYDVPLTFPLGPPGGGSPKLEVWVGLHDPTTDRVLQLATGSGLVRVAEFGFPPSVPPPDVDATVAAALAVAGKDPQSAWDQLEYAFRRVEDYGQKAILQKALLQVGRMAPPALTFEERDIVQQRIADERARHLRLVAGHMFDAGKLLGALLLLDEAGGALQEQAGRAVLGALAEAQNVTRDRRAIADRVFALDPQQEQAVADLVAKHPAPADRLATGERLAKDPKQRAIGRDLVRSLESLPDHRDAARAVRERIERAWLADVPPEQRAEAEAAMRHPCWDRTAQRVSHRFVLIGPRQLVDGVPADSLLRFDLAYLYLTDLFGRVPNPGGDRLTVYFKELWNFGGGVGGGKIIDIGNADPAAKEQRVDDGLLYHELVHCVEDCRPVFAGFKEGFADFGAAFAQMQLGQVAAGRASIGLALRAFQQDYVARDLEYWRIPSYGPSAGFLLHFLTTYGKDDDGYRWDWYRRFFRDFADCPVNDGRTPGIARAFAHHLVQAFGADAFRDLQLFRWPLLDSDLEAIALEQRAAVPRQLQPDLAPFAGSPVPRDKAARALADDAAPLDDWARELGVVRDLWVIGPFRREGCDSDRYRFPPELEIDLQARYESIHHNPTWRQPGPKPVTVRDSGWVEFDFAYMDDSAFYALTHVTAERDLDAWFWLRADDDLTLWVDDEWIDKFDYTVGPFGPWRPDWRTVLPDAIRYHVPLAKGRHKVLLKVRNGGGASGFALAIAQQNGTPLAGWTTDLGPPTKKLAAVELPDGKRWPSRWKAKFDTGGAARKLQTTVGGFRARNGALEGTSTDRQVEWRKHTVRPGFPKDSPSNLAWLPEKVTEQLDALELTLDLAAGSAPPKLALILQGDGQRDALSGWTLLLEPAGDGVRAHLERYDRPIYTSAVAPFAADPKRPTELVLSVYARRLTVRLGGTVLFDQAPIRPIPDRTRIGLSTWGDTPRIEQIELRAPPRTR